MVERYTRRTAILAAIETVYGTGITTFTATDAILLVDTPNFEIVPDNVERKLALPWLGHSEELPSTRLSKLKFKVEMVSSGAAGTPPVWGKLLRACGFAETIVAANRVEYVPISQNYESLTFRFYRDGVRYVARGGRGMVKFNLMAYTIPTMEFEFWAFDTTALADTIPAIDLNAFQTPQVVTTDFSGNVQIGSSLTAGVVSGGTLLASKGVTWDMGIQLKHRKLLDGERVAITDRAVTGKVEVELSAADEIAWRASINAVEINTFGFVHGTAAGKKIGVFCPRVQRTNPQAVDDDGNIMIQADLRALPGKTGLPEMTIVAA